MEAFNIGDAVTWSRANDDVAKGEIGEVVGFRQDPCRVRVHFKKGTWKCTYRIRPGNLTIVTAPLSMEAGPYKALDYEADPNKYYECRSCTYHSTFTAHRLAQCEMCGGNDLLTKKKDLSVGVNETVGGKNLPIRKKVRFVSKKPSSEPIFHLPEPRGFHPEPRCKQEREREQVGVVSALSPDTSASTKPRTSKSPTEILTAALGAFR